MQALLIKPGYVGDLVAVIVTVANQHTLAVQHLIQKWKFTFQTQ